MDKITDLLNRILNAQKAGHRLVVVPFFGSGLFIANILKENGFIKNIKEKKDKKEFRTLEIILKDGQIINGFKRISRPGQRIYQKNKDLKKVKSGYGLAVVSTPKGVFSAKSAKKQKIGGEVWFEIW